MNLENENIEVRKKILEIARSNISNIVTINNNISFVPGGFNGPYFDIESPVRNTAHWCVTYTKLAVKLEDSEFKEIAHKLARFLTKDSSFIKNGIYVHRQKRGKDWSNGIIGQAWAIEALAIASRELKIKELKLSALEVASKFPFDWKVGAWKRIDPRTNKAAIDYTLNHQLWYAAALSELDDTHHNEYIHRFLTVLNTGGMRTGADGRVVHLMHARSLKALVLRVRYALTRIRNGKPLRDKEIGYHLYNLHPLSRLKKKFPSHPFFSSNTLCVALKYSEEESFHKSLDNNRYAYPYNSPAFEFPLIKDTFNLKVDTSFFLKKQIEKTYIRYDFGCGFYLNCPDPMTLNSRLYELLV